MAPFVVGAVSRGSVSQVSLFRVASMCCQRWHCHCSAVCMVPGRLLQVPFGVSTASIITGSPTAVAGCNWSFVSRAEKLLITGLPPAGNSVPATRSSSQGRPRRLQADSTCTVT
jgi:hypothetical protein